MASKERRFAQDTEVPVHRSKAEIEAMLERAHAGQIIMGADKPHSKILLAFTMQGMQVRLNASTDRPGRRCSAEQLEREAWRAMGLILKAKLEYVAMGATTVEREFLANLVLPGGSTVADDVLPKIAELYQTGHLPPLLPA